MFEGVLVAGSSAMTALICLHANEVGNILGVIDRPDGQRKHHARPTPLMGGLAILVPFLLLLLGYGHFGYAPPILRSVLIIAAGLTVLGYLDDRRGLDAKLRLLAGILLIGITILTEPSLVLGSLRFGWTEIVFSSGIALAFTILVVLGLINAVNMADGMNGIVPGSALIWTLCLAAFSPPALSPLLFVLGALLAVVLAFNLSGKLFLGDAGAYGLGGLFSILAIHFYNSNPALTADVVVAWFIVPVLDCLRLMASRGVRGRSPLAADCNHLHHRLERLIPSRYVVFIYWAMVAIPSFGATMMPGRSGYFIGGVVAVYVFITLWTSARPGKPVRRRGKALA